MNKEQKEQKTEQIEVVRDMSWLKNLLNNIPLLKFVRKFSADNLLDNNELAEKFGVVTNEDSVSVADDTLTKVLTSHSMFGGKEIVRYNIKQIKSIIDLLGDDGELIITESKNREMIIQIKDTTIIVCPLPKDDKGKD